MPNDIRLQEGHPVDENLRPIKVGDKSTALETAQAGNGARVNGDLEVTGSIPTITTNSIVSSGDIIVKPDRCFDIYNGSSKTIVFRSDGHTSAGAAMTFHSILDDGDYFRIDTTTLGATIITTLDDGGEEADLTLNIDGFISMNSASGENITFNSGNSIYLDANTGVFYFYDAGDFDDYLKITVVGGTGATTLATISDGDDGHLTLDVDGTITLDSNDGNFIAKKAGTEFSAANSAYAGMILGYTRISNDSTTTGHAEITPDATLTVMQTAQGTDVSVTFVAPPSGNVEISMLCHVYANSKTLEFALSDNATFNEIGETHTYDGGAQGSDETDVNMTYVSFVNTGLTAGTEYERWIGAAETVSGTSVIRHGRNRSPGAHYPPIIVKAIALPATITTGE